MALFNFLSPQLETTKIQISPYRVIDYLEADVVLEEIHHDEMVITDHPVEVGSTISDHAYKRPAELSIECGWSNSGSDDPFYVQRIYKALLELQLTLVPFDVYTGKRHYRGMVIKSLSTRTNVKTENSLIVYATFQQINIVNTRTVVVTAKEQQAAAEKTQQTTNTGTKQLTQAGSINTAGRSEFPANLSSQNLFQ